MKNPTEGTHKKGQRIKAKPRIPNKVATEFHILAQIRELQHFLPLQQDQFISHPQPPFSSWEPHHSWDLWPLSTFIPWHKSWHEADPEVP